MSNFLEVLEILPSSPEEVRHRALYLSTSNIDSFFASSKNEGYTVVTTILGREILLDISLDLFKELIEKAGAEIHSKESIDHTESIQSLELSLRPYNALMRARIQTIGQLVKCSVRELDGLYSFGIHSRNEVIEALAKRGLFLEGEALPQ